MAEGQEADRAVIQMLSRDEATRAGLKEMAQDESKLGPGKTVRRRSQLGSLQYERGKRE